MKKKKFNVQGTVLANIVANGIEANTPEEAVKIFKDKFESLGIADWTDWHKDIEVSEVIDYTSQVNAALYNSGYGVKVVEMPKQVVEGTPEITNMIGKVEFWRCKLNNGKDIVVFIRGGKVFLPCNPLNYFLVFDSDCCEATKINQPNDVFRYYWLDNNDVYTITKDGTFMCIYNSESNYNPIIGQRLSNVRAAIDEDVYVIHSTAYELNLGVVDDENAAYDAIFEGSNDTNPSSITLTKRIL